MYNVLVTGIGGVVGQGILRNIKAMQAPIRLIGTDTHSITSGHHLCDFACQVPYAYDQGYIPTMIEICNSQSIDLIIPSTDYEVYYLKKHENLFQSKVIGSCESIAAFCLDKYENYKTFQLNHLPFAETLIPSEYKQQFKEYIVKPRKGRGSRQIFVNPEHVHDFNDEYCIQPLLKGIEITTACYITKQGDLLGHITFFRQLEHGNTVLAEVRTDYDKEIQDMILKILKYHPFRASFNIQSIVIDTQIIPFEINCRISGTNSFRSFFGFKDVEYCIREYLFNEPLEKPQIRTGFALRRYCDVVYPDATLNNFDHTKCIVLY